MSEHWAAVKLVARDVLLAVCRAPLRTWLGAAAAVGGYLAWRDGGGYLIIFPLPVVTICTVVVLASCVSAMRVPRDEESESFFPALVLSAFMGTFTARLQIDPWVAIGALGPLVLLWIRRRLTLPASVATVAGIIALGTTLAAFPALPYERHDPRPILAYALPIYACAATLFTATRVFAARRNRRLFAVFAGMVAVVSVSDAIPRDLVTVAPASIALLIVAVITFRSAFSVDEPRAPSAYR